MCGIAGIYNRNDAPIDPELLVRMTRTMVHRGPDEEGYFVNSNRLEGQKPEGFKARLCTLGKDLGNGRQIVGNVGFGHRRLSIIDLSTGQQPLSNEDGSIWISFNGEIYNFQQLKQELEEKGHRFQTNSDTEAIVHAYEEWGEKSVERLRGMFAYSVWDENKKQLFLARDRIGKKPLYYSIDRDRFVFGSELKSILEIPEITKEIDLSALSDYLSLLYVPSPKSIFSSIKKLPAGHFSVVTKDSFKVQQYWDLSFEPCHEMSEPRMIDELLDILEESIRLRMISDVPLGAFLSGGIDSSAVVALMSQISGSPVVTNSISFGVAGYDESKYASQVANQFGSRHNEFKVTPDVLSVVEKLAWHYDEPFADSSAVPTYYVSKMARQNVTVSLSGDGGDENFAGYRRYYFDMRENLVRNLLPNYIGQRVFGLLGTYYPKLDFLPQVFRGKAFISNVARDPVEAYFFSVSAICSEEKRRLLNPDVQKLLRGYRTSDLFHSIYQNAPASDHLSRIQYLDIKTYLCEDILTKVDRASMAVSLEVRCPILDHAFMEFAARIPSKLKLSGTNKKHIFKKALRKFLPDDILFRKKMGFAVPITEWLRTDLRDFAEEIIFNGDVTRNFLQRNNLEKIWTQHQNGIRNRATEIWSIMMVNLWYNKIVQGHNPQK